MAVRLDFLNKNERQSVREEILALTQPSFIQIKNSELNFSAKIGVKALISWDFSDFISYNSSFAQPSSSDTITFTKGGIYEIFANVSWESDRRAVSAFVIPEINANSATTAVRGNGGYVHNASDHKKSGSFFREIFKIKNGDELKIYTLGNGRNRTATMPAKTSLLMIKKIT